MRTVYLKACVYVALAFTFCFASGLAHATTYDVGASFPFTTLSSVPWPKLLPGDTVNIHGQATPYYEQILLTASGTAAAPITVQGVPGPNGEPAVIDGTNAYQSPSIIAAAPAYAYTYTYGVVQLGQPKGSPSNYVPSYIHIQNLTVQNGYETNSFTSYKGTVVKYNIFSAGIYATCANHLVVSGCTLTGNGLGLFVNSNNINGTISHDLLIEGNSIYGNGAVGDNHEHNCYTEAIGTVYQYNYLGNCRAGSQGSVLKDRSAGTVIRYNWIGAGGHCLDLVETQGGQGVIDKDPSYKTTYVYGNTIYNAGLTAATSMIHYGGDQYNYLFYRRGTLYFYNNTVVNIGNQVGANSRYYTELFLLPGYDETANNPIQETIDCRNNIIYTAAATPGTYATDIELIANAGTINLGTNWVSNKWLPFHPVYGTFLGHVSGTENMMIGDQATNAPGFNNVANQDFTLTTGSPCLGREGAQNPVIPAMYAVTQQYLAPSSGQARQTIPVTDLGAMEGSSPALPLAAGQKPVFRVSDAWVVGVNSSGGSAVFGIQLSAPSTQPVTVTLATADGTAKSGIDYVPTTGTVTIAAGQTSGTFIVPLYALSATMAACQFSVNVKGYTGASPDNTSATGYIVPTGLPPTTTAPTTTTTTAATPSTASVTSLTLSPSTVTGGQSTTGTIVMSASESATSSVTVTISGPAVNTTQTVNVAANATTATFTTATPVNSGSAYTDTISASTPAQTTPVSANLTVNPTPVAVTAVTLSPTSVVGGVSGAGTVTLNFAPSAGTNVTLNVVSPSGTATQTVTVPAGSNQATFSFPTAVNPGSSYNDTVQASATGQATPVSAALAVAHTPVTVTAVTLDSPSIVGGAKETGTVTLSYAVTTSTSVTVKGTGGLSALSATVTIPVGSSQGSFSLTTPINTGATYTATVQGAATGQTTASTASVTVQTTPLVVNSVAVSSSVVGGANATGTVTLSYAPATATSIKLAVSSAHLNTTQTVAVAAGSTKATFSIATAQNTGSAYAATVSASAVGQSPAVSASFTITQTPVTATSISFPVTTAYGGTPETGTVKVSYVVASNTTVSVVCTGAQGIANYTVTVPAGSSQGTFVTTAPSYISTSYTNVYKATAPSQTSGAQTTLLITPPPSLKSLTASTTTYANTGSTSSITVTVVLTQTVASNTAVPISCTVASSLTKLPATITVPAGSNTGSVTVTEPDQAKTATAFAYITGKLTASTTYGFGFNY